MRIAQVTHLTESVPPKYYGGAERVVSYLTEELIRQGHDVTLFASGDSITSAKLVAVCPTAIRTMDEFSRSIRLTLLLERVFGSADAFDIIHSHLDFWSFPLVRRCGTPSVTTVHGNMDFRELKQVYSEFPDIPLVSISMAQRTPCPWANWKATIPHGLPTDLYQLHAEPGRYLAFLGRVSPEKGIEEAIMIAQHVGMPLRIAAKVDPVDEEYFRAIIRPKLTNGQVEYLGEITDKEKNDFLGSAIALLCPYRPESFGLVLVEALACGTPVVTFRHGSFPEIIDHGITGFLCNTVQEMIDAIPQAARLDRTACRRAFDARFTAPRMAGAYVDLYEEIIMTTRAPDYGSYH